MLIGKWQATEIKLDSLFLDKQLRLSLTDSFARSLPREQLDSILNTAAAVAQKNVNDGAKNTTMEFQRNGTAIFTSAGNSGTGQFTLSDDSKTIMIDDSAKKMICPVLELTRKKLVLDLDSMMTITMTKQ